MTHHGTWASANFSLPCPLSIAAHRPYWYPLLRVTDRALPDGRTRPPSRGWQVPLADRCQADSRDRGSVVTSGSAGLGTESACSVGGRGNRVRGVPSFAQCGKQCGAVVLAAAVVNKGGV